MRRRWYYWKRTVRANRPVIVVGVVMAAVVFMILMRADAIRAAMGDAFREYGVRTAYRVMKEWFPAAGDEEEREQAAGVKSLLISYLENMEREWVAEDPEDPAYERILAELWGERYGDGRSGKVAAGAGRDAGVGVGQSGDGKGGTAGGVGSSSGVGQSADRNGGKAAGAGSGAGGGQPGDGSGGTAGGGQLASGTGRTTGAAGNGDGTGRPADGTGTGETPAGTSGASSVLIGEVISMKPSGSAIIREKLADFDYVMQSFYSVHPTTTAGRDLIDANNFLNMDLSIEKDADAPQILIYHTHSQEEFADYPANTEAKIPGVGAYLAELLEARGYRVIHDTSVYDLRDGTLDRSQAYTYALDGINGILQKYPSIEVVLDIHRDGVSSGTHLVTEVNGKPTAQIMFFNGTSQTPDGPIEYLPNPNREANLAFSFQMQLKAAEQYPGFTRKIYLKGLRYNLHVRARSALIEVGAQTNTYEEARNAMEPLADLLDQVLRGE